ncbi:MarR family transcriptional regulator [Spirillospora sp. CA-142024]|uniref:MarR family transcriptional regulator n=1 Tax=Spirillospora sp. CA-142024 TaxID=3240036 RepID=UPI003D925369
MAAFMFADQDGITAPELAERLGISSGAVSGAIKMLSTVGLIARAPAPDAAPEGSRMPPGPPQSGSRPWCGPARP